MKKLTQLEHLKTLKTNCTETFNNTEKNCLFYTILTLAKLRYFMPYTIKCLALLTRKCSYRGIRNQQHRGKNF